MGFSTNQLDDKGNKILEYPRLEAHPRKGLIKHTSIRQNLDTLHELYMVQKALY